MATDVPLFNKEKHVTYWLRCLRSPLPTAYTTNDANRMTLAYFTLSALDLLGVLFSSTSPEERKEYADWIYSCQHPSGGFRGFPGTDFGAQRNASNAAWDPPNLAATYFAIGGLCVLRDDLSRIDRQGCLACIKELQTADGTFAELRGADGELVGGSDPRFTYMAASICWILGGSHNKLANETPRIDTKALVDVLHRSQSRDGGFSGDSFSEAHAGLTFCAIATLCLLQTEEHFARHSHSYQEKHDNADPQHAASNSPLESLHREKTIEWLVNRFTRELHEEDYEMSTTSVLSTLDTDTDKVPKNSTESPIMEQTAFQKLRSVPARARASGKLGQDAEEFALDKARPICWAGFAGRCNKIADTCYAFWAGASLKLLGVLDFVDHEHVHAYLLEKTQHAILGGFGKHPSDLPDIYHSYMGLAALSLIDGHKSDAHFIGLDNEDMTEMSRPPMTRAETETQNADKDRSIRALDPMLCMSRGAREWIESLEWHQRT